MAYFGGSSRSSSRRQEQTGPVTAAEGSRAASMQTGGRSQLAAEGAINLARGSNLGGYTFGNIGQGATITLTQSDNGAVAAAQALIERVVNHQANTTAAALSSLGGLTETRITDGGNLAAKSSTVAVIAVAVVGGLLAAAFYFRK